MAKLYIVVKRNNLSPI